MLASRLVALIMLGLAVTVAHGQTAAVPKAPTAAASEWMRGNRVTLGVTQERLAFSALWRFARADNGDILIEKEENRGNQTSAGSVILVGNGALLLRNLHPERGRELDALNGPLLMLQLALQLLERAVPAGPRAVTGERPIAINEASNGIKVNGVGAQGEFFAPWSLKGTIGAGPSGQIKFELEFVSAGSTPGAPRYESSIAGIWQNLPTATGLPNSFGLRGWRVHQIKDVVKPLGMINTVGLGVSAAMLFANLGEVRRSASQWSIDGERRARHQCN